MEEEIFVNARTAHDLYMSARRTMNELDYITKHPTHVLNVNGYPLWRYDRDGRTIEDGELNKKITELVIAHMKEKHEIWMKEFKAI